MVQVVPLERLAHELGEPRAAFRAARPERGELLLIERDVHELDDLDRAALEQHKVLDQIRGDRLRGIARVSDHRPLHHTVREAQAVHDARGHAMMSLIGGGEGRGGASLKVARTSLLAQFTRSEAFSFKLLLP